jgi:iron(III) transport system permease protein
MLVLAPHVSLLLLSFATIWSFSPLPDAYMTVHYMRVFSESFGYIKNTLIYATLAGRGPGAALGVMAVLLVAACTYLSHLVIEKTQTAQGAIQ